MLLPSHVVASQNIFLFGDIFSSEALSLQSKLDLEHSLDSRNWLRLGSDVEFAASIYQLSLPELELAKTFKAKKVHGVV
jgi:hypothetical protein